jgi:hypothetical protein
VALRPKPIKGGGRFYRKFPAQSGDTLQQIGVNLPKALSNDKYNNIPLQDGDSVYVPTKWVSVKVSGEVGYPNNVLYKAGKSPWYYIDKAGGLTRLSDKERIRVKYANGEVSPLSNLDRDPDPGAEIIVPHKPEDPPINWVRALSATASVLTSMATFIVAWVALQRLD